jgi:tetratricopeptide (TPR) repeat protein
MIDINSSPKEIQEKAEAFYKAGNFDQAAQLYKNLADQFSVSGKILDAAEMLNNSSVASLQKGDAQSAYEAAHGTDKIFEKAGDSHRQAIALGNQAAALEAMGNFKEAILIYQQSSELLKSIGEKDMRIYVLKSLSSLQVRTGDQLQALASMDAALQLQKKLTWKEKFLKKLLGIPFKSRG